MRLGKKLSVGEVIEHSAVEEPTNVVEQPAPSSPERVESEPAPDPVVSAEK